MKNNKKYQKDKQTFIIKSILFCAFLLSLISIIYFFDLNTNNILNDAASRLNITRKIIDNLTPGLAQFGDLWLPLPQILMLPLVWNNFLWHSGLAGGIMSGFAFIVTTYFLYKTIFALTKNTLSGIIAVLIFISNSNALYLQTTAMSELLFVMTIAGSTYFLIKWSQIKDDYVYLILAGVFVSASTLIRYEGYFFCLFSIFTVAIITYLNTKKIKKVEGKVILFATMALTGIISWMIYEWVIFGNPFYWKNIYGHSVSIISTDSTSRRTVIDQTADLPNKGHLFLSIKTYWESTAHMNGIIITIVATFALLAILGFLLWKKNYIKHKEIFILFLPLTIFLFVTYSLYMGSIPLDQPPINKETIMTKTTNFSNEYNIRYGFTMIIFISLILGFISSWSKLLQGVIIGIIVIQLGMNIFTNYFVIYSLATKTQYSGGGMIKEEKLAGEWLKKNYDGGLIMISALKHDPVMFYLHLDYKNFIHEGAGKYWTSSRFTPQKYATWIYMYKPQKDEGNDEDSVTKYLAHKKFLPKIYNKVYENEKIIIYKIKNKKDLIL